MKPLLNIYIGELPHLSITNPAEGWVPEEKKKMYVNSNLDFLGF